MANMCENQIYIVGPVSEITTLFEKINELLNQTSGKIITYGGRIEKYGFFKGCFLGIIRILKCNPFAKGGYDPLK